MKRWHSPWHSTGNSTARVPSSLRDTVYLKPVKWGARWRVLADRARALVERSRPERRDAPRLVLKPGSIDGSIVSHLAAPSIQRVVDRSSAFSLSSIVDRSVWIVVAGLVDPRGRSSVIRTGESFRTKARLHFVRGHAPSCREFDGAGEPRRVSAPLLPVDDLG